MLGSVTANSARLWVRTASEMTVTAYLSLEPDMGSPIASEEVITKASDDYTGLINLSGLRPNTQYYYQVEIDGEVIELKPVPFFHTYPVRGEATRFDLAFGGGSGYTPWHEHMWNTILSHRPHGFLALGDNVYIDTPKVPQTQRYCYYRRQSRPEYRTFSASTPIYAIWDDHDFGTNDCSSSLALNEPPWKLDVLKIFRENYVNPYYGGDDQNPGCWFDFSIGDVDFFLLDCRFYRQNPKKSENATMIGPCQKKWLLDGLLGSKGTFKVIASSVPWAMNTKPGSKDTWDGFPEEREEIFSFIEENSIGGVVLLSADRHRSDARKIERKSGYDLYDFMSSRLTNVHTHKVVPGAIFGYNEKCSFGLLSFDTRKADPEVTYSIINIDNEVIHALTLRRSSLTASRQPR
jgi:alkaline phosphatase D